MAFHGKYYKGFMRDRRTMKRDQARARQQENADRGHYVDTNGRKCDPAPVEWF